MTRMTGPDCVVRCNLINTHTHTILYSRSQSRFRVQMCKIRFAIVNRGGGRYFPIPVNFRFPSISVNFQRHGTVFYVALSTVLWYGSVPEGGIGLEVFSAPPPPRAWWYMSAFPRTEPWWYMYRSNNRTNGGRDRCIRQNSFSDVFGTHT